MKLSKPSKKPAPKKELEFIHTHSQNEEKTLKKFCADNPEIAARMDEIDLSKVRISQKNLVYVIGLSNSLAREETLMKHEYFGQYGRISKVVVYKTGSYGSRSTKYSPSLSAYLTYSEEREASLAIFAVDGFEIQEKTLHCSYGTTKYCSYFLRDQLCPNKPDCVYLHSISKDHEYYYLSNHKNGTEDQRNSLLSVLRKSRKDFSSLLSQQKPEACKSVLPSIFKVISELTQIFAAEEAGENYNARRIGKPTLTKSQSTNSEDKRDRKAKPRPANKLLNIVDWEDEAPKKNPSEAKTPESKTKLSEDLKQSSEKNPFPQSPSLPNPDDFLSNPSPPNEESSSWLASQSQSRIEHVQNPNFFEVKSPEISKVLELSKSPEKSSFEGPSFELIENKAEENGLTMSPGTHKTSLELNEKHKGELLDPIFYNSLSLCNEIEMKIIKNMLNETNQKSRFSFVQSEQRNENKENSLKEILITSLKMGDFRRTCSMNCNESMEKEQTAKLSNLMYFPPQEDYLTFNNHNDNLGV